MFFNVASMARLGLVLPLSANQGANGAVVPSRQSIHHRSYSTLDSSPVSVSR